MCIRVLYAVFHFAGSSLWVAFFILVFRVHAEGFAFVARLDFVFFVGRACDGMAVCQPLVFDAVFRHAVFVADVRAQFLADFGFTADFDFAKVVIACIVVGDADFGAVVAWVAVAVFQDVFDWGQDCPVVKLASGVKVMLPPRLTLQVPCLSTTRC